MQYFHGLYCTVIQNQLAKVHQLYGKQLSREKGRIWVSLCSRLRTLFSLENLGIYSQSTTKSIVTTQGMQIPFVYHYVEQISDNSPYSFKVLNFLILFHLKFRALHRWHLLKKNLKHILLITINSVFK